MDPAKAVNYWDYIRVEELLALQSGLEHDDSALADDEVMFITVHQVYELWFKLVLRELRSMRNAFRGEQVAEQVLSGAVARQKRIVAILRRCIDHFEVMETLSTRDYLGFRDKLMPASGFQSAQLRQIEILLGLDDSERMPLGLEQSYVQALRSHDGSDSPALRRVQAQLADVPTVKQVLDDWLWRTPIDGTGPHDLDAKRRLDEFVARYIGAFEQEVDTSCKLSIARALTPGDTERLRGRYSEEKRQLRAWLEPTEAEGGERRRRIRAALVFIATYRELPLLAWPREFLDGLLELEQVFTVFRQRHARMVERVIGRRTGTGGSAGVDYLDQTALRYRVFRDLWALRTFQIRLVAAPALQNASFYGFKNSE